MPDAHPSGRPIRTARYVSLPIQRQPRTEPLTPGLRCQPRTLLIGFPTTSASTDDDEEGP